MIAFLLWAIVLILFRPLALIIAVGALVYGLIIAGFWLIVFSIKIVTYSAVIIGALTKSLLDRRSSIELPQEG